MRRTVTVQRGRRHLMENVKLGRAVLDQIDGDPEHFDMGEWATVRPCGTTACLAGWTMILAGYTLVGDRYPVFYHPDGSHVQGYAREAEQLLGMEPGESGYLLYGHGIWSDAGRGLERFRALVEAAENAGGS